MSRFRVAALKISYITIPFSRSLLAEMLIPRRFLSPIGLPDFQSGLATLYSQSPFKLTDTTLSQLTSQSLAVTAPISMSPFRAMLLKWYIRYFNLSSSANTRRCCRVLNLQSKDYYIGGHFGVSRRRLVCIYSVGTYVLGTSAFTYDTAGVAADKHINHPEKGFFK